jgi:tRNA (adenine22-N1)-methyltransferase
MVTACDVLADIGTDHAYIPIEAIRTELCKKVIASDIKSGPLKIAERNIKMVGYEDFIETRLGDGLQPLAPNEANCIIIAGMGGIEICKILKDSLATALQANELILQPQRDCESVRRNLHAWGFEIMKDRIIAEDGHYYIIIKAVPHPDPIPWTDKEYYLSKLQMAKGGILWHEYLMKQRDKITGYIDSVRDKELKNLQQQRINWITEEVDG